MSTYEERIAALEQTSVSRLDFLNAVNRVMCEIALVSRGSCYVAVREGSRCVARLQPQCNPSESVRSTASDLLNKISDLDDGLDYPQPSIRGSDPEPRRSRTDTAAGGGRRGDGH